MQGRSEGIHKSTQAHEHSVMQSLNQSVNQSIKRQTSGLRHQASEACGIIRHQASSIRHQASGIRLFPITHCLLPIHYGSTGNDHYHIWYGQTTPWIYWFFGSHIQSNLILKALLFQQHNYDIAIQAQFRFFCKDKWPVSSIWDIIDPPAEGPGAARTVRATADRRGGNTGMGIREITWRSPSLTDYTKPQQTWQIP